MRDKFKYFLLLILVLALMPFDVFADGENIISLEADKNTLIVGDEITIEANLKTDSKLYALTATLSYDTSVFEIIDGKSIKTTSEWSDVIYNSANNKFGLINKSGEISSNLLTIKLKVKDSASVGKTSITLSNVSGSDANHKIDFDTTSIEVLITRDASKNEVLPSSKEQVREDKEIIIEAAKSRPFVVGVATIIGGLVVICIVINLLNKNNKKELTIAIGCAIVILSIILMALFIVSRNSEDVNDDGKVDYGDASEIIKYLIDLKGTLEEESDDKNTTSNNRVPSYKYDVNNDGYVDIQDAASSTQSATNRNYKVTLGEIGKDNYYYGKDQDITLEFAALVQPSAKIEKFIIDGVEYPAIETDSSYIVKLKTPHVSGVHNYEVTGVILDNNRQIKTYLKTPIEVLKDKPSIKHFEVVEGEEKDAINFEVQDVDKAFMNGNITIFDEEGEIALSKSITNGKNSIEYQFKKDKKYAVIMVSSYDLDSDLLNEITGEMNEITNENLLSTEVMIASKYDFKIENIYITKELKKGESPYISFNSTNSTEFKIAAIELEDGTEYEIMSYDEKTNLYVVKLPEENRPGDYEIKISKVVLESGKVFNNGVDFEEEPLQYVVLKDLPVISIESISDESKDKNIKALIKVTDVDKALKRIVVKLTDTKNVLETKEIPINDVKDNNEVTFSYADYTNMKYSVIVYADYDLASKDYSQVEKEMAKKDITISPDIYVSALNFGKVEYKYPEKGQIVYLKYTIVVPTDYGKPVGNMVTGITINGLNYTSKRTSSNGSVAQYDVSFKVPSEAGVYKIETNRIMFIDGSYVDVNDVSIQMDVLKDKPVIDNFKVESEDYVNGAVTFSFDVNEDGKDEFKSGQLLVDEQRPEINAGHNEVVVEGITKDKLLDVKIQGNYDRDTDELEVGKNYLIGQELFSTTYGLYDETKYENASITDFKAISKKNNIYFEKNEQINLNFKFSGLPSDVNFDVDRIIINTKEYKVNKTGDTYSTIIDGYSNIGIKNIQISEIILTSGKKISLKNPANADIDILKDIPEFGNFEYDVSAEDITIKMSEKDSEHALVNNLIVKVFDEDNNQIGQDYTYNGKSITIPRQKGLLRYYVKVYATYNLDSKDDNNNRYINVLVLNETISLVDNRIEMKDITDIVLYRNSDGNSAIISNVSRKELESNLKDYFVKISMSSMPDVYVNIKRVEVRDGHLLLVLDYNGAVSENGKDVDELIVDYGKIEGNEAINDSRPDTFASLVEKIKQNPEGNFTLDHDLDATGYTVDGNFIIDVTFKGTINGNGHTIKNLNVGLFQRVENATIKDLKFVNVKLKGSSTGLIAGTASNSNISGILIDSFEKRGGVDGSGVLVGRAENKTQISQSRVTNLQLYNGTYNQVIGGIVGRLNNSVVSDCYVIGTMDAGWHFIGGIAGYSENGSKIENCYTKVKMGFSFEDNNNGGITGTGGTKLINNVSLSTSNYGYAIAPGTPASDSTGNYQLEESNLIKNEGDAFKTIKESEVAKEIFKNAKFDEKIWVLDNVSYEYPPVFKIDATTIPNSDRIKENENYTENKDILYKNLYLLTPFYDSEIVVKNGAKIAEDNILNTQEIAHIIPIDKDGHLVTYLTDKDYKKIAKIKVVFKNDYVKDYDVVFDKLNGSVVGYRISGLKIDYTFNHYLVDEDSTLVKNLVDYLSKLDYTNDLDPLTTASDSRLYRDHYNEVTKKELKEFVLKYLSNSNQVIVGEGQISKHIEKDLKENDKLKKVLYVYNYFRRWYSVDINGVMLNDFTLFNTTGFNEILNPDDITLNFFAYEPNFNTDQTNNTYNRIFKQYTNINDVTYYIEYLVKILTNNSMTTDKWFSNTFKGYLLEISIDDRPDITYTAWSHIRGTWQNYALVILTLPKDSTYILSSPTQFLIGSERTYIAKPYTEEGRNELDKMIREYAVKVKTYYTTAASIIEDAKYFNAIHNVQIDHRFTKDENGVSDYQSPYVTEEGFHKNFSEPLGQFTNDNGTAAGANGSQVKYVAYSALTAYGTWSHESAHNQDARLFLLNNGRRWDAGGEDYADGNLSQRWSSGEISMNISIEYDDSYKNSISTNLSPSRINSPAKIKDFYSKVFDTYYILDYLEAQAFVQLTPEEQSVLAFKISYRNINDANESQRYKTTQYTRIDASEYAKMNLKGKGLGIYAVESLYDNMITVYPGMPKTGNYYGDNKYGAEKLQKTRWYAPYNDNGRPDSYSLKLFAYEMLGYKGYVDGYVEYYSNIHADANGKKTDLMALRRITGNNNMTFRQYRLDRFKQAESKLANVKFIDANEFVKNMYLAFKQDAKNIMEAEKSGNNNSINNAAQLPNSSKVKMDAYYALKNGTDDFRDDIYSASALRQVHSFEITTNN